MTILKKMPNLSQRSSEKELMDRDNIPKADLYRNLEELEIVNTKLGGYAVVLGALDKINWEKTATLSILDVGSGGGDTLRSVANWAKRNNRMVSLTGIDLNPIMTSYAVEHSANFPEIQFQTMNVYDEKLPKKNYDVVMCSLFCHHFAEQELTVLLKRLAELAKKTIIINDLHRHWLAYHSIKVITAITSKSYLVKNDAPLSVARAFTRKDWEGAMEKASLADYKLTWKWAFRWQLIINIS